ncbi:protein kinase domain-containing protein [Nocardia niwae]|uniref:Protein kinase n=1 Tax=Nocardia niwae TaxID=626084 RepID=A0ABV2XEL5_9NOCA
MSFPRTDAVARFTADWQRSLHSDRLPPQIRDYVPDGTQARLAVLVDLIRVDLRRRWEREGLGKRVAEYRGEFPEVDDSPELVDLVCEEFLVRRRRGRLSLEDFLADYLDLAGAIRARFAESDDEQDASSESLAALADLAPGLRIDDFDLLTDLGAGLLGRVFLARQRSMQRLVAVRFSAGRAGAPRTMAQLDHAHIVRVFDQRVLSADATPTRTKAATPANGSHRVPTDADITVAAPRHELDALAADSFDLDATAAAPPARTAGRPGDEETLFDLDATVAAAPPRRTPSRPSDDETIAEPPPTGRTSRPGESRPHVAENHGATVTRPSVLDEATVGAGETVDDETVVAEPDRSPPLRSRPPRTSESGRSTDHAAIVAQPDAAGTERPVDPDATIAGPPDNAGAARVGTALAPESRATVLPRLVYMQYLPGGTAAGLLEQRRHGPVSDGGALLLRAVDSAMEARGEIRPSDSSVRAEIARLSWPETVAWVGRRLADALDYAAHQGVLHHDIKPANVLFTAEGIPKLADFTLGESAAHAAAPPGPGALVYRSPEQLACYLDPGAPVPGDASDVYSLGVLLWELLTGATPFDDPPIAEAGPDAETYAAMLAVRRAGVSQAALARLPEDTPAALRRVLLDCLHEDPERRWRGGAELAAQLDLCLDTRARDLVDPPPRSLAHRARGWLLPVAALCVGVPNVLASFYNIQLNQALIIDRMSAADQEKFAAVGLINNLVAFPVAAVLLLFMTRRPLAISYRLGHGRGYSARTLAKARRDTLLMGDWAVWIPFGFWLVAGIIWPLGLAFSGVDLPRGTFLHFFAAQVVCAAIALAYPFFPIMVYAVRSIYPQLLVRGGIGPDDERQLRALARRGNFYLGVAASVPLLGVASATFVDAADLELVIVPVRVLSVGGILAFVLTYRLFRLLEADLLALARAIPQRTR